MPEISPHALQLCAEDVAIIQAAVVIKGKPATNLGQLACRELIECPLHHQFDNHDAGGMEDTAQQTPLDGQLVVLADIAKGTQGKDGAIEFCSSRPAERIITNRFTPLL